MINSPARVFGASKAVEDVIHEEIASEDEQIDQDENLALNITESLHDGAMSPSEKKYHDLGLLHIQQRGVSSKSMIFWLFYNYIY